MVYDYMKKQLAAVPQALYRQRYPAINDLDRYYVGEPGVPPENNVVARNLCRGKWLEVGWHARLEWVHLADNVVEGLEFADPERGDFRLKDEGPARRIGFQPNSIFRNRPRPEPGEPSFAARQSESELHAALRVAHPRDSVCRSGQGVKRQG